ncbi:ATP-binding cassette domain-containing protein [Paenibacillus nasutitermitis]|uniref:Multidrug ABC transporter ATP-binding protein n=1 Tax=Paenibacillus nasutitermitis TaxID=1652958 RepID=A0A916Z0U8_9BACL|nr:ABC transporter ATP-binding protein [Paenibacillus nasutitermitis]GGD70927.1 multidrug ABC transporter ATP-binding protein [Paenibacillus nasutitermitis]
MIEVKAIKKTYGRKKVLSDVSFTAEKGQITCLIGINGVGKSTVLKAIMGLIPIDKGRIHIDEQPLHPRLYERITFVPDAIIMPRGMTVLACMRFMQDFYRNWNPVRAIDLLAFFKLKEEDKVGEMSKGNAAKLNLLLGLAMDSDYILMDEPFSGIDMFSREQIASILTSELIEDRGVIITTHEINDIEHLLDKAVLMDQGSVLKEFDCEIMRQEEGKSVIDVMREVYRP